MRKLLYKLGIIILTVGLLISGLKDIHSVAANTIKYNLAILTEEKEEGKDKLVYWSGEQIMPRAFFDVSGSSADIPNPTTKITVPKVKVNGKLVISKPIFVKLDTAKTWTVTEDDDNWYVTYNFEKLTGGSIASAQFPFKFENGLTPDGTKIEVKYELFDDKGTLLDIAKQTYTSKAQGFKSRKFVERTNTHPDRKGSTSNNLTAALRYEFRDTVAPERTPAEGYKVRYGVQIYPEKDDFNKGTFNLDGSEIKLVDHLPAGAELAEESKKDGWIYDEASHTATWQGIASDKYHLNYHIYYVYSGWGKPITLVFKNYPIYNNQDQTVIVPENYIFENTADFYILPGTDKEKKLESQTARALFESYETKTPPFIKTSDMYMNLWGGTSGDFGDKQWNNLYDTENHTITPNVNNSRTVYFTSQIEQTNNGSSPTNKTGGITHTLKSVRLYDLDQRLHFKWISIEAPRQNSLKEKFNRINNKLYGIKEDGSQELIKENLRGMILDF